MRHESRPSRALKGWQRLVGGGALFVLVALTSAELLLQIASIFAPDRTSSWRPEASNRIICVGDSHTWGTSIEREEAYPAQLLQFLEEEEPQVHSVINLGLPGLSTTQLRHRVPDWLSRYQPDVMIIWAGVNNAWNTAELEDSPNSLLGWLDRQLIRTRLYRLVRVRIHDRSLERYTAEERADRVWQIQSETGGAPRYDAEYTVTHEGVTEQIAHSSDGAADAGRIVPRAVADLRAIMDYAEAANVRVIFVSYPINLGWYEQANLAMWKIAKEYGRRLVYSPDSLKRVAPEELEWHWRMHPGAATYREIARDIARVVLSD